MYGGQKKSEVKEQIDYSDVLFRHIDRVAMIASQPNVNLWQLSVAVDFLAAMISFLEDIKFTANPTASDTKRYKDCIAAFEKVVKILDSRGMIFKYRIKGHIGGKAE